MTQLTRVWPRPGYRVINQYTGAPFSSDGVDVPRDAYVQRAIDGGDLLEVDPQFVPPVVDPAVIVSSFLGFTAVVLRSLKAPSHGCTITAVGRSQYGDRAGGPFVWDAASTAADDGGTTFGSAPVGRWIRLFDRSRIEAAWFGALGNGSNNDTAAIQAALNAAATRSCNVYFSAGEYRITQSIVCGTQSNGINGISISGANSGGGYEPATLIRWDGASTTTPSFWLTGYDFVVENLGFVVASGRTLYSAIEYGKYTSSPTGAFTSHGIFRGLSIQTEGQTDRHITYGLSFGSINAASGNIENCLIEECLIRGHEIAAVHFAGGTQPYNTTLNRVLMSGYNPLVPKGRGLSVATPSSSFHLTDCDYQSLGTAIYLTANSTITVTAGQEENCKKFYNNTQLASGLPGCFTVRGTRVSNAAVQQTVFTPEYYGAADVAMIKSVAGETIILDGITMADVYGVGEISLLQESALHCRGNTWPQAHPYKKYPSFQGYDTDFVRGNYIEGDSYVSGDAPAGGQLARIPNQHGGHNSPGTATISGTATYVDVSLPNDEFNDKYLVKAQIAALSGGPAVSVDYVTNKTHATFRLNVATAPGAGKSVTYTWETYR